jgi:hypothetical protein
VRRRILIGLRTRVLSETPEGLRIESVTRLRPGQLVDVARRHGGNEASITRSACVESWAIVKLGSDGPVYQGLCRWQ